jgi:hypothetical protein
MTFLEQKKDIYGERGKRMELSLSFFFHLYDEKLKSKARKMLKCFFQR